MLDPLYHAPDRVKLISPRHEQVAAHVADAYFRVRHEPVATLTSCGPVPVTLSCRCRWRCQNSSAVFAITANVRRSNSNRSPFQESIVTFRPTSPTFPPRRQAQLSTHARRHAAVDLAPGDETSCRAGRDHEEDVDVPFNVFQEEDEVTLPPAAPLHGTKRSGASPDEIRTALDLLLNAKRPVIFIGHGVTLAEASKELTAFAHKTGVPVISSPNGMGCLDMTDPLSLGFIGRNGAFQANEAGRHADVVLAIGARFDDRSASSWIAGYSWNFPHSKLIHIDVDHDELGRNYPPDLAILADARTFLRQMLAELHHDAHKRGDAIRAWHAQIEEWRQAWEKFTAPNFEIHATPIRPERIVADCQAVLPDDAILALRRGGQPQLVHAVLEGAPAADHAQFVGLFRYGIWRRPASWAPELAAPDRPCVAIAGDGCFSMVPHVLCTAVEYNIPVVWVIWNNFGWVSIRDIQLGMFGGRELGTMFHQGATRPYNPDFAGWAKASGVDALTVTASQDFKGALEHAVKSDKPFLLDVHVDANVRPPPTGTWHLPPTPYKEPTFGKRWMPGDPLPAQ